MRTDFPRLGVVRVTAAVLAMMLLGGEAGAAALQTSAAQAPTASGQTPQTAQTQAGPTQTGQTPAEQTQAGETQLAPGQAPAGATPAGKPAEQKATTAKRAATASAPGAAATGEGITEEQVEQMLGGKMLFLRGGYLEDRLSFDEDGRFTGDSPRGSYTLCGVKIEKARLTKHRLELTGQRYGLHFLGALASEDSGNAFDTVKLTAGKKELVITIDREAVEEPKKFGFPGFRSVFEGKPAAGGQTGSQTGSAAPPRDGRQAPQQAVNQDAKPKAGQATGETPHAAITPFAPETPAQADRALEAALGRVFASGIDGRLIAAMPGFWQLYYKAAEAKSDYQPSDGAVLREDAVDQKARLLTIVTPASNEYAQAHGVSGMALYRVVVGADGKAGEIAVARPIGFGLDENAVAAIRKASFQPAVKDGKAVPVLINLVVEFRIYSKQTAVAGKAAEAQPAAQPPGPVLPGPYSVHP